MIHAALFTSWRCAQALEALNQYQTHFVVNAQTGHVTLKEPFYSITWPSIGDALKEALIPSFGRVRVHVE